MVSGRSILVGSLLVTLSASCGSRASNTGEARELSPGAAGNLAGSSNDGDADASGADHESSGTLIADAPHEAGDACMSDDQSCVDARVARCTDERDCAWPNAVCVGGSCQPPISCRGLEATCGPRENGSCCAAGLVPGFASPSLVGVSVNGGGSDTIDLQSPVHDFRLDQYEVTVGRFRQFVSAYPTNLPAPHSGKNPHDPSDTGWDETWNAQMPSDPVALTALVNCDPIFATWTNAPTSNENRPINA